MRQELRTRGKISDMQVRLLGGVSLLDDDGGPIDPGPAKCQELLGALVLSSDRAVSVPTLVDLLWDEDPPRTAAKTLQTYVARLRKAVGHDRVARVGGAYRLDVPDDAIDVRRFRARLAGGDVEGALAEWTGMPLAGLDAPGLQPMVDGLVEEWLAAVEAGLAREVESDPQSVIGRLTELTASHPFREGFWAQLMTALYAVDRQAEALAAYRRARHHLVEELGVEPGPRLKELEAAILDQDDQLAGRPRPAAGPNVPTGTITFAFSDVEGSSRLWARHRQHAAGVVSRHEEIVRDVTQARGGYVFATGGDSFGVAFDRAGDAAGWAGDLQAAIASEPWPAGIDLRLRIGLHTGDAEERSGGYFGPAVNLTARIASAGHGGQTLVSTATAALLDGEDLRELGVVRLEDIGADHRVFQLGPGDHPPLRIGDGRHGNLPRSPGRLFGRAQLVHAVADAIEGAPVVTLVGPGGIGKTRLATEVARLMSPEHAAGAWLVELADVASDQDVARAVADVLDAGDLPGRSLVASIVTALAPRDTVLVLDNCEHVVDGAAELAEAIAEECPDVRVLATSREGLGIDSEQLMVVGPLDTEGPGVDLFEQRALALDRSFDIEVWREPVAEICRRLDGVPLAIELAAARIRSLSPADMVERLEDSFRLLSGGRRKSVERHRTLRATLEWSYDLLSVPEQVLFRRLSVFAGSFDLAAAEHIVSDRDLPERDINGLLGDLVDRSMVVVESGTYGRRFRLLEIMRQFGQEQLADNGNSDRFAERHARSVADEVGVIADLLVGHREIDGAARLVELWPNLRAAFDWAEAHDDLDLAKRLVGPLAAQSFVRRGVGELVDWAERLLAMADPDDDETIALGLLWCSFHHVMTQDRESFAAIEERYGRPDHVLAEMAHLAVADASQGTLDVGPRATEELRRRGLEHQARVFEVFVGGAYFGMSRLEEAEEYLFELSRRLGADGPPTFLNWTLFMLGAIADFRGDVDEAAARYNEALAVPVPPHTNSPNEVLEARAAFRLGDHRHAYAILRTYIDELLHAGNMSGAGLISLEFVNMATATGRMIQAGRILGYLDRSGMLDVEGRGFRLLLTESEGIVDAHPEATTIRRETAATAVDDEWALVTMRDLLDELLDSDSTDTTPTVDPDPRP